MDATIFECQMMAGRQFPYALKNRERVGHITEREISVERLHIYLTLRFRML